MRLRSNRYDALGLLSDRRVPRVAASDGLFDSESEGSAAVPCGALPFGVWIGAQGVMPETSGVYDARPAFELPGQAHRVSGDGLMTASLNVKRWLVSGTLQGESFSVPVYSGFAQTLLVTDTPSSGAPLGSRDMLWKGVPTTGIHVAYRTRVDLFGTSTGGVRSALVLVIHHGAGFFDGALWSPALTVAVSRRAGNVNFAQTTLIGDAVEPDGSGGAASVTVIGRPVKWRAETDQGGSTPPANPGEPSCSVTVTAAEWW